MTDAPLTPRGVMLFRGYGLVDLADPLARMALADWYEERGECVVAAVLRAHRGYRRSGSRERRASRLTQPYIAHRLSRLLSRLLADWAPPPPPA